VPIPGTRRLDRVEENIGAAKVVLTPGDLDEIEEAASSISVEGARLPDAILKFSYK
jgi:aryl-alcohol dehydrogenase-like predicted oxidoreductase